MSATDDTDQAWTTSITEGRIDQVDGVDNLILNATLTRVAESSATPGTAQPFPYSPGSADQCPPPQPLLLPVKDSSPRSNSATNTSEAEVTTCSQFPLLLLPAALIVREGHGIRRTNRRECA